MLYATTHPVRECFVVLPLPRFKKDRIIDQRYEHNNQMFIWDGKYLKCEHGRQKKNCVDCGGSQICGHGTRRIACKKCGGSLICDHGRERKNCKKCGGVSICDHGKRRYLCKLCDGGGLCIHKIRKGDCIKCGGNNVCDHQKTFTNCKICRPKDYFKKMVRSRAYSAMKKYSTIQDKKHTIEYIGCSWEDLRTYLENQFEKEAERCGHPISWENQGEWHIDHIKPCASFNFDLEEERHKCLHFTNLKPMWGPDNLSKSDTYNEDEDERVWDGEKWN